MIFVTCMYNRPQVSELYLLGLNRLRKIKDFKTLVAVSDEESKRLCEKHGITHFEYENFPLGKKHNERFRKALESKEPYIVHSGDDDIMSDDLYRAYLEIEVEGIHEYIKPRGLLFYEPKRQAAIQLHDGNLFGAFRMFKSETVESVGTQLVVHFTSDTFIGGKIYEHEQKYSLPKYVADYYIDKVRCAKVVTRMQLYNDDINKGLDFSSESKLIEARVKPHIVDLGTPQVVDVKSSQNIWNFDNYYRQGTVVSKDQVLRLMREDEKKQLEVIAKLR